MKVTLYDENGRILGAPLTHIREVRGVNNEKRPPVLTFSGSVDWWIVDGSVDGNYVKITADVPEPKPEFSQMFCPHCQTKLEVKEKL